MSDFIASLPEKLIDPPLANQNWDEKISGIVMNAFIAMHSMQCMNEWFLIFKKDSQPLESTPQNSQDEQNFLAARNLEKLMASSRLGF